MSSQEIITHILVAAALLGLIFKLRKNSKDGTPCDKCPFISKKDSSIIQK